MITLENLTTAIKPERTVLLFGAGSSIPSGAPTSKALLDALAASSRIDSEDLDLRELSTVIESRDDVMHKHGRHRSKEIERVARIHRDPFEPILPVLESDSPVGEYRKITEEILRLMPDEHRYPRAAAEAARSFLMLRLGLHLGLRQKNLRELLICPRNRVPTSERQLEDRKCGELRWSSRDGGWEVLIPSVAFKNATSSFFGAKPFRLVLPDLLNLYEVLEAYIDRHRSRLLNGARDPGTLFVKTVKVSSVLQFSLKVGFENSLVGGPSAPLCWG